MRFRYDLQTGAVTVDGARLYNDDRDSRLDDLLVRGRQVLATATFIAQMTVGEQL